MYLNKRLAEMKCQNINMSKEDNIKERIKQEEIYKMMQERSKNDQDEHKKLYKNYLDHQVIEKNTSNAKSSSYKEGNTTILPSYFHENLPVPTFRKAVDTLHLLKNNKIQENTNKRNVQYNWESKLNHNPITRPLNDVNYNKYLSKSLSKRKLQETNNDSSKVLLSAANAIMN